MRRRSRRADTEPGGSSAYERLKAERPAGVPLESYDQLYRLACQAALYSGIAEEALTLLTSLAHMAKHGLGRDEILKRAAELSRRLDAHQEEVFRGRESSTGQGKSPAVPAKRG